MYQDWSSPTACCAVPVFPYTGCCAWFHPVHTAAEVPPAWLAASWMPSITRSTSLALSFTRRAGGKFRACTSSPLEPSTSAPRCGRTTAPTPPELNAFASVEYATAICSGEVSRSPCPTARCMLSPTLHGRPSEMPQLLTCLRRSHASSSAATLARHARSGTSPVISLGRSMPVDSPTPSLCAMFWITLP